MKKRIPVLLLVLCLTLSLAGAGFSLAEEPTAGITAPEEERIYTVEELGYDRQVLTVGTITPLTGCFFSEMWGNGTSDLDVMRLLHGYSLTGFDTESQNYIVDDTVVSGYLSSKDRNGDREYRIYLQDDLTYSDGTPITAWDYAFSILLAVDPAVAEIGANQPDLSYIVGAEDYAAGRKDVLSGVRVIDDLQLSVTVKGSILPYFYELSLIDFVPYPIAEIAPGTAVKDDGNGVYIANAGADFNADLLRKTVLDEKTGYMTFPKAVSGPYRIVSFDGKEAVFEKNPCFKGDRDGNVPDIDRVVFRSVEAADAVRQLESGEIAVLHKAMDVQTVQAGSELTGRAPYLSAAYPRNGLCFVSFCCERPGVSDKAVRQAIAMCLDKETLTQAYVGSYGTTANGFYGIGQWMYQIVSGASEYPTEDGKELAKWQKLNLNGIRTYAYDTGAAAALLEKNGWKADPETGIREKKIGSETVRLELTLCITDGNGALEMLNEQFVPALREAGILLTVESIPWEELIGKYYRTEERTNDMFWMASNFTAAFDPTEWFDPAERAQGLANKTAIADKKLYDLANAMMKTAPNDVLGYCTKWISFLEYMADVMPVIPVYSNIYFDFYTTALQNYEIGVYTSWADALVSASYKDVIG